MQTADYAPSTSKRTVAPWLARIDGRLVELVAYDFDAPPPASTAADTVETRRVLRTLVDSWADEHEFGDPTPARAAELEHQAAVATRILIDVERELAALAA